MTDAGTSKPSETKPSETKAPEKDGSFTRWQGVAREQLGGTVNLVLTLTVAALAYGADFFAKKEAVHVTAAARDIIWLAEAILALAAALGIAVNLSRLSDFRWTARAARLRALQSAYAPVHAPSLPNWLQDLTTPQVSETLLKDLEALRKIRADNAAAGTAPQPSDKDIEAETYRKRALPILASLHDHCRTTAYRRGRLTWLLFPCQLILFCAGIIVLAIGIMCQSYAPAPPANPQSRNFRIFGPRFGPRCANHLRAYFAFLPPPPSRSRLILDT